MKNNHTNPLVGRMAQWFNKPDQKANEEECLKKAHSAKEEVSHILEGQRELQAIGIATCGRGYSIEVNLSSPLPKEVARKLPKKVEGVPVNTEIVGSLII
ncbi:hypothetical protein IQ243_04245 [Nostocales cyanobacterium LEGE 11386]|nr:hypothetical protein [Nostocales cyanobacterium LEGE 11386]